MLTLAGLERFDPQRERGLARLDLAAEALLPLGDADSLSLELRGDALLPVVVLGLDLRELALELLDARARLGDEDVAAFQFLDELLGALLGLGGARAVALQLVQHLGQLLAALVREVVDEVARWRTT